MGVGMGVIVPGTFPYTIRHFSTKQRLFFHIPGIEADSLKLDQIKSETASRA